MEGVGSSNVVNESCCPRLEMKAVRSPLRAAAGVLRDELAA